MFGWFRNATAEPVLYITTEQELEEVQTMMLAFVSGVDEDHILNNNYVGDEEDRVDEAVRVLERGKIFVIELPDFSLRDVENLIKQNIRENGVKYVFFDYIMSSLKILEEIAGRAGGVKLREDNILFMLSRRLKDIANEYGVFVLSGTQLNGDWKEADTPDQNLLRGAKSIADSIDLGMHILPATQKDFEGLETILSASTFDKPNVKLSIYKNRRGRYKGVFLWCKGDLSTCRIKPMFATTWDYEIIPIDDLRIETDPGAF
jgi:replicative DNA helicase